MLVNNNNKKTERDGLSQKSDGPVSSGFRPITTVAVFLVCLFVSDFSGVV